jgi:cell division transport system permease protein
MSFLAFFRIIKMGFQGFWRNRLLSLAAVLIMTLTLLIISIFVALNSIVDAAVKNLHEKIDLVIFFKDEASEEEILQLKRVLANQPETKSITYVNKQEAEARYRSRYKNDPTRLSSLEITGNVLPRSLEIKAEPPEALEKLAKIASSEQFKDLILPDKGISYYENKALIDKLLTLTRFLEISGISISIFFILVTMLTVFNTIKLTVFSRRDEIEIMRLVGATESFVKLPFAIEGILYGVVGTFFATLAFLFLLKLTLNFYNHLGPLVLSLVTPMMSYFKENFFKIVSMELMIAVFIGTLSALLAIGRRKS